MTFQPGANLYTQGFGSRPENIEVPHIEQRDPAPTDINYPVGKRWLNTDSQEEFILYSFIAVGGIMTANWATPVGATGAVISLADNSDIQTFPDENGSIQVVGVTNQINVTSNPSIHQIQLGATNPFNIAALTAGGPVNLASANNNAVTIGNSLSVGQNISIDSGSQVSILVSSLDGQLVVGNSGNSALFFCPTKFFGSMDVQGSLIAPDQGIGLTDGTFSQTTSISIVSGTFNCSGAEGILRCAPSAAVTINLSGNAFPGSYVTIYDSAGTAGVNNITINAVAGGAIFQSGVAPATSYVINTNYGNVVFYLVGDNTNLNYIIFNQ